MLFTLNECEQNAGMGLGFYVSTHSSRNELESHYQPVPIHLTDNQQLYYTFDQQHHQAMAMNDRTNERQAITKHYNFTLKWNWIGAQNKLSRALIDITWCSVEFYNKIHQTVWILLFGWQLSSARLDTVWIFECWLTISTLMVVIVNNLTPNLSAWVIVLMRLQWWLLVVASSVTRSRRTPSGLGRIDSASQQSSSTIIDQQRAVAQLKRHSFWKFVDNFKLAVRSHLKLRKIVT